MKHINKIAICILIFGLFFSVACNTSVKKRPFGYLRLGPLSNFLAEETFLEKEGILLRKDLDGFYAMSTYCTHDLSHLSLKKEAGVKKLVSNFSDSSYDLKGQVLTGPAKADLPFYKLEVAAETYEIPTATLYVKIGEQVSSNWRLSVPAVQVQ